MSDYSVPYTFIAGTRAKASQVNANFEYVTDSLQDLKDTKASIVGDAAYNFSVAEPVQSYHAVTKRYVDLAVENAGGGGSGVGKSMFEVFHTLSTKTPNGAFSLRTGEVLTDAENTYTAFWEALEEQGTGLIPDFTDVTSLPDGYTATFSNIDDSSSSTANRAFSPYSWFTTSTVPSSSSPIVAELELPETITCSYFRINSHVVDTYNSSGDANSGKAIKVASISVRQADDIWQAVSIINETEAPTSNERYYENTQPKLEFNAIRIVISENFGASETDISVYPVDPETTSVRVVPEEQWQWEVKTYGETGAFVLDTEESAIRLPKITRMLSGVSDLWQIGIPESNYVSKSSLRWQEGSSQTTTEEDDSSAISLDTVYTGLWIQVYNAVAEDALSNIRYIPHAVLFEERPFHFIPDEETGWAVSDGNWKDGNYYTDAMTELMNQYASAVTPSGKAYKLATNGMRFVDDDTYQSTYKTYGEVPYYVVDSENYRFKTPMSDNYIRYTHTIDNANDLLLDAAPNITGDVPGTEAGQMASGVTYTSPSGAFYTKGTNVTNGTSDNNTFDNDVFGFDASRSNSVYGRADEVRPKSSYYLMCVFLGNEIPQSSSVDVLYKVKAQDEKIAALEETASTSAEGLSEKVNNLTTITEAQATKINENATEIENLSTTLTNVSSQANSLSTDIVALQDKDELVDTDIANLTARVDQNETDIDSLSNKVFTMESSSEGTAEDISDIRTSIDTLSSSKADKTYVDEQLATKQIKLTTSSDFTLDEDGNLSLKVSPVDAYTKEESDSLLNVKADKSSLSSYAKAEDLTTAQASITELQTSMTSAQSDISDIQTNLNGIKFWTGTQTEYDAIETKDATTLYIITG